MNNVHVIYNEDRRKFMVDYEEVIATREDSRSVLSEFINDLNRIQYKRNLKVPWWFWVYMAIFISAIPILIVFCWPAIVAMAGLFLILLIIVIFFKFRNNRQLRSDVDLLCNEYKHKFKGHFSLTNYFNKNMIPPSEHDYENLAVLLVNSNEAGCTQGEHRLSRKEFRESRKSRISKPTGESYVQVAEYLNSER